METQIKPHKANTFGKFSYLKNNVHLTSRYFFAPINAGLATKEGNPTDELISFHEKRSGKGIGINYVGNVSITKDYVTNNSTLFVSNNMQNWEKLVGFIEFSGSLPGVQVACYKSDYSLIRKWKNKDNDAYIKFTQEEINSFTTKEIDTLVKQFIDASVKLIKNGFKVIQIHAGHGYFLSTFTSKIFNRRTDEYGKDPLLILKRIFDGVRAKAGYSDYWLDLRISVFERSLDEDLEHKLLALNELTEHRSLDMISQVNGLYNLSKKLMYPNRALGHCFMKDDIAKLALKHPEILWNLCGNIWDLEEVESTPLPENITFSVGRALLADEYFVEKSFARKKDTINKCTFCNKCHYYSMGLPHIACGINPNLF